jgi:hypothetical protein
MSHRTRTFPSPAHAAAAARNESGSESQSGRNAGFLAPEYCTRKSGQKPDGHHLDRFDGVPRDFDVATRL